MQRREMQLEGRKGRNELRSSVIVEWVHSLLPLFPLLASSVDFQERSMSPSGLVPERVLSGFLSSKQRGSRARGRSAEEREGGSTETEVDSPEKRDASSLPSPLFRQQRPSKKDRHHIVRASEKEVLEKERAITQEVREVRQNREKMQRERETRGR